MQGCVANRPGELRTTAFATLAGLRGADLGLAGPPGNPPAACAERAMTVYRLG
jgi:hypothetical protein